MGCPSLMVQNVNRFAKNSCQVRPSKSTYRKMERLKTKVISHFGIYLACLANSLVRSRKIRFLAEKAANSISGAMLNELKKKDFLFNSFNMPPEIKFPAFSQNLQLHMLAFILNELKMTDRRGKKNRLIWFVFLRKVVWRSNIGQQNPEMLADFTNLVIKIYLIY